MASKHIVTSFTIQLDSSADDEQVVICTYEDDPMEWHVNFDNHDWSNIVALRNAEKQITKVMNAVASSIYHVNNSETTK